MDIKTIFTILSFGISLLLGLMVIPHIVLISKRKRLFDKIDARKEAKPAIPRLGGIAFFPLAMFSFAFMLGMRYLFNYEIPSTMESNLVQTFMFVTAGLVLIYFVGLADDLVEVGYKMKFSVQLFCAFLLILAGLSITNLQGLMLAHEVPAFLGITITVLFVVYTINSFNLIDGVNGLCSGMSMVALLAYGSWFLYDHNYIYAMFALSMLGVVLAFFIYNIQGRRLQIFMGDTGSLTLGYMISFLTLQFINSPTSGTSDYTPINTLALAFGLLFVPLFDTLRVFCGRIRIGLSPFHPDRSHIHHKLLELGYTHIQSTLLLIVVQILFFGINIVLSQVLALQNTITLCVDLFIAIVAVYFVNKGIKKRKAKR